MQANSENTLQKIVNPCQAKAISPPSEFLNEDTVEGKKCNFSKKCKIITSVVIFVIISLTIGLSVGLTMHLRPRVVEVMPANEIRLTANESVRLTDIKLKDVNMWEQNLEFTVTKFEPIITSGRLLQEGAQLGEYTAAVNFQRQGITAIVKPDSSLNLVVDPILLTDFIISLYPDEYRRLLSQEDDDSQVSKKDGKKDDNKKNGQAPQQYEGYGDGYQQQGSYGYQDNYNGQYQWTNYQQPQDWSQIQNDLTTSLSQQLNQGDPVQQQMSDYVTLRINEQSKNMELQPEVSNRMLLEDRRRRLFLGGIIKRVANVVKKVVSPVVKAVRTAGPYIGAAVGGVGGFIVGGPAGAFAGAKTGYKIGSLAKSFVNACIPRNSFRLRCDKRQLLMNGVSALSNMIRPSIGRPLSRMTGFTRFLQDYKRFRY